MRISDWSSDVCSSDLAVLERADIRSLLASIEADTIVLSGALDPATPFELGEEIDAALPRARHEVVPGAAHHLPAEAAATMKRATDGTLGHEACASCVRKSSRLNSRH